MREDQQTHAERMKAEDTEAWEEEVGTGVRPRPLWGQALNRTGTPGSGSLGLVGATQGPWGNVSLVPP